MWLNTVLVFCEYMSFAKSWQEKGCSSQAETYISKWKIYIYYIHTEKYSPKSGVVNLDTQMSSSQSEEWTMVFTCEKNDTSNQNRERCFFTWEKNDTSNQKPQRCVSFAPKFPPFLVACWAPLRTRSRRKVFLKGFFLVKKWKTFQKWSGIVSFVSLSIKKTVESQRNNSGKG